MNVSVTFEGGPHNGMSVKVGRLEDVWLFFDQRNRDIIAYVRDELVYQFNAPLSKGLTGKYEETFARWAPDDEEPPIDQVFGEEQIKWDESDDAPQPPFDSPSEPSD